MAMANNRASRTQIDDIDVEDGDSTQPATPPCSKHNHILECEPKCRQVNVEFIDSYSNCNATWKNGDQAKSIDKLCLYININTFTNKAMLKLSCQILLRQARHQKQAIYVYIYPTDIRAITFEMNDARPSLHFSMYRHPKLIVPAYCPTVPKPGYESLLESICTLSLAKDFTVRIDRSEITELAHLQQVASIFSSTSTDNRPKTDKVNANLQSLYIGRGGEDVNARGLITSTCNRAGLPPPYEEPAPSGKRKRRTNTNSECSPTSDDNIPFAKKPHADPKGIEERLINYVEKRLGGMEERIENNIRNDINDLKTALTDIKKDISQLESNIMWEINDISRQNEETIHNEVGEQVNGCMENLCTETRSTIADELKDKGKELDNNLEDLQEKFEEFKEHINAWVRWRVKKELSNIRLQVSID
ncbi:hypothetical protein V8C37DRAFT_393559 [Trichoderma ceciliae]